MSHAWNMIKMRNGGHLEFLKTLQGDSRGLLVCYSWHFSEHILKVSVCYYFVPGSTQLWANALGLIIESSIHTHWPFIDQYAARQHPSAVAVLSVWWIAMCSINKATFTHTSLPCLLRSNIHQQRLYWKFWHTALCFTACGKQHWQTLALLEPLLQINIHQQWLLCHYCR